MGNQSFKDSNANGSAMTSRQGRATLQQLSGTWFVDNKKILIEENLASVYVRDDSENWVYEESLEVKDEQLHFQFRDHILSKGRLRGNSTELMFRNGEDVRLWTREDPFVEGEMRCIEDLEENCLLLRPPTQMGALCGHLSTELGGDCLSLRHPSQMGALCGELDCTSDGGAITPDDSYGVREEALLALPSPGDSTDQSVGDISDQLLPEVDPSDTSSFSYEVVLPLNGDDSLSLTDCLSNAYYEDECELSSASCSSDLLREPSWVDDNFFTEI